LSRVSSEFVSDEEITATNPIIITITPTKIPIFVDDIIIKTAVKVKSFAKNVIILSKIDFEHKKILIHC